MDAEDLKRRGLFMVADSEGRSILHKRRLKSSSEEKYSHIPLAPHPWMCGFEQIPTILFSVETLLYVGLRMPAAQEIWERWVSRGEEILPAGGNIIAFLNFFVDQVAELPSDPVQTSDEEWSVLLSDCENRLNTETIAAAYTVRSYWEFDMVYGLAIRPKHGRARVCCALDLVRSRYRRLLQIWETSLQRERNMVRSRQDAMVVTAAFSNMEIEQE
jgi:hypothetical protein